MVHISRKTDSPLWLKILVKVSAIITAFLIFTLIIAITKPNDIGKFYTSFIDATFANDKTFIAITYEFAILFACCICLMPAFNMKFWNLGIPGQVGAGLIGAFAVLKFTVNVLPDPIAIILMLLAAVICSVIWSVIPAIFKAFFNTNEVLFTLMMNYICLFLIKFFVKLWANTSTGSIQPISYPTYDWISNNRYSFYIIVIVVVLVLAVLVTLYLKKSKQGYEVSVVGGSQNTAKYIGINVKKVIIRTLGVSGILCGILAFIIMLGSSNLSSNFNDKGYGFTAVLTLWSGSFNPILAGLYSYLYVFVNYGVAQGTNDIHLEGEFNKIFTPILFLLIVASEFFLNYKISFIKNKDKSKPKEPLIALDTGKGETIESIASSNEGGNR